MDAVVETFGSLAPRFERVGSPTGVFPYPFVGYRRVPDVAADRVDAAGRGGLAEDLGLALTCLHSIDAKRIAPTPAGWEHEPWSAWRTELVDVADGVRPVLGRTSSSRPSPTLPAP
jgi:hypothetical protein